jgi:hypothetical protein
MYKKISILVFYVISAFAIVSIAPVEVDPKKNIIIDLGIGYKQFSGDVNKKEVSLDGMLQKHFDSYVFYIKSSYEYANLNGIANQNSNFGHIRYIKNIIDTNALEIFTQFQADEFKAISSRILFGGGDRIKFENKTGKLFLGMGMFWVQLKEQQINAVDLVRLNSYIAYNIKVDNIKINYIGYYQPNITNYNDFQIINILQFIFKIDNNISFGIKINHEQDSMPANNKSNYNLKQNYNLIYKKEF